MNVTCFAIRKPLSLIRECMLRDISISHDASEIEIIADLFLLLRPHISINDRGGRRGGGGGEGKYHQDDDKNEQDLRK